MFKFIDNVNGKSHIFTGGFTQNITWTDDPDAGIPGHLDVNDVEETNLKVENEKLKEDLFEARQALLDQSNAMSQLKNKLMLQNLQLIEKEAQEKKHVEEIIKNVIEIKDLR